MAAVTKAQPKANVVTTTGAKAPASPVMLQKKFNDAREVMRNTMIERDVEIDIVFNAMLCKEHVLFVGPPGCAKSHLLNSVLDFFSGGRLFSYLMTKFTTPEEIFGPYSLTGLKADKFYRVTSKRLPEADLAYLDEIFKASPAILNTLLTIMNEGTYDDGRGSAPVPLRLLMASSNEIPRDDDGLNAMYDRFLLRRKVRYITNQAGRKRLLWGGDHKAVFTDRLSMQELDDAIDEVAQVPFSNEAKKVAEEIIERLRSAGINPSDRRLVKSLKLAKATAWLDYPGKLASDPNAKLEVTSDHFDMLSHSLWVDAENHPQTVKSIVDAVSNPMLYEINTLMIEAEQIISGIDTKDLGKLAKSTAELKKLEDILKKFRAMPKHKRVEESIERVSLSMKEIVIAMTNV